MFDLAAELPRFLPKAIAQLEAEAAAAQKTGVPYCYGHFLPVNAEMTALRLNRSLNCRATGLRCHLPMTLR